MRRFPPASTLYVAHARVWLVFGVSAASIAAQPASSPIRQSTTAITRGQSDRPPLTSANVRYPTMLDMTFPEFEAAVKRTDIVLLPVGSIEEHSVHLPLSTDAINSTALLFHVQQYLDNAGVETILGPPLNIGITYDGGDRTRAADPKYPGNLTVRESTFAALYLDVLRSLRANGLRRAFLWPGHGARGHNAALIQAVDEANRTIDGMHAYVLIDSETLQRMKLRPSAHVLSVEKGRNFELLAQLLGRGAEMPRTTHADGVETSWTLYFHPEVVRQGYQQFPAPPLSILDNSGVETGRSTNPAGSGGFPFDKASAAVGKQIVDYKTTRIGDTILRVVRAK
jgi:creatinine amidohydrolase